MKRFAYCVIILLILVSVAGCGEASNIQGSSENPVVISQTAAVPLKTLAPTPTLKETPTPSPVRLATPSPSPQSFDATKVSMQSTPNSSCFTQVGYDATFEVLVVQFRDSNSIYTYLNFPTSEWDVFMAADSLGSWYNKHIKNKYECERID